MADIKWLEGNRLQIDPPKRTKKITGTRFATILGLNPWSTAFEMWCAITLPNTTLYRRLSTLICSVWIT